MTTIHQTIFTGPTQADIDRQIRAYVAELDMAAAFPEEHMEPHLWGWAEIGDKYPCFDNEFGKERLLKAIEYFLDETNPRDDDPRHPHLLMMVLQVGSGPAYYAYEVTEKQTGFDRDKLTRWLDELQRTDD